MLTHLRTLVSVAFTVTRPRRTWALLSGCFPLREALAPSHPSRNSLDAVGAIGLDASRTEAMPMEAGAAPVLAHAPAERKLLHDDSTFIPL